MKANHNANPFRSFRLTVVSSTAKVVKWKQITTVALTASNAFSCFQYGKGSKMKANHNDIGAPPPADKVVSSTAKVVKWKQITTSDGNSGGGGSCFQYGKGSKMKANHNHNSIWMRSMVVVSSTAKVVKWKQITTQCKDRYILGKLFPVRQR